MKAATIKPIKTALDNISRTELIHIILRLSKFKKENKELLSYLLFESNNEQDYIQDIKVEMDEAFKAINTSSYFYIKKSVRKILKSVKTYIRYSNVKETEVELLLYFCKKLRSMRPSMTKNQLLINLYTREIKNIEKKIGTLHEDLQHDYTYLLDNLKS
ncbi:hypothetical protein [Wenyingzhuangia marina]|uniref:Uncharacterized protein n=1 Tax=Wenyingzhuangia marina TaxID=1195760 RepID=A0A1M5U6Y0_9FLAO|nr:hypothetical protein [Wenyingzhuangia marina]GGF69310.1 hypothetical protein GCM10011397_10330 [Wenyingzhuangia marina]SHH58606.1 hypothetical protein SAMN05444281_1064 [Wenyingzhuangia marina]